MRKPPPARLLLASSPLWCGLQALLLALAAEAFFVWAAGQWAGYLGDVWRGRLPFLFAAVALALGVMRWRQLRTQGPSTCWLDWDGTHWALLKPLEVASRSSPATCTVAAPRVMLDLGPWMLLQLRPTLKPGEPLAFSAHRWPTWAEAASRRADPADPAQWHAFRAAVYSEVSGLDPRSTPERPPF